MQFKDLKKQYQHLKTEIDAAIQEVLDEGNFINGRQVREFEEQLAEYVGVKHCISCANGTDAMTMVLMAWNIKEGDAVFVPDFTFFSTAEVVALRGATPVFVDVKRDTFNIDVTKLELAIEQTRKEGKLTPKVIIPVDLFGLPAEHIETEKIAKKYNLLILEDGAQGLGGSINGKMACSFGDAATTSFFPAKPLGCYGDGGAVFTDNDELAEIIKSLKVHGKGKDKYDNVRIGLNSRLDTIQAAILKVKLKAFKESELAKVQELFEVYNKKLCSVVETPSLPENYATGVAQYTIKLKNVEQRDHLLAGLKNVHTPSFVYYQKSMHQQHALTNCAIKSDDLSISSDLCKTVISLPLHPYIEDNDINSIFDTVCKFV